MATKPKSAARAREIRDHLNEAFRSLADARLSLAKAGYLAATDYDHNADPIRTAHAGADLTLGAVIRELGAWERYADARERNT